MASWSSGEFWKASATQVPSRITPFIRHSTVSNEQGDLWLVFVESLKTSEEYGPSRDKEEARLCMETSSCQHHPRTGKQYNLEIAR